MQYIQIAPTSKGTKGTVKSLLATLSLNPQFLPQRNQCCEFSYLILFNSLHGKYLIVYIFWYFN